MANKKYTTFLITGGAGRVVCAIPALERFAQLHPKNDFRVIVHGWESLYWSHPLLQSRTFGAHQKGLFESFVKKSNIVSPEPYHINEFFNQKVSLIEAFDIAINQGRKRDQFPLAEKPNLYLSNYEIQAGLDFIEKTKMKTKKRKVIVFQPFGSAVQIVNNKPVDPSNRSLELADYTAILKALTEYGTVFFASKPEHRHAMDKESIGFDDTGLPYFRMLMALLHHADYFCGADSVGQHVARAFNTKGLVLMGGTNDINFSYPDHFKIYRKIGFKEPIYSPWRLVDTECEFADRENNGIMEFTDEDRKNIVNIIKSDLSGNTTIKLESNSSVGISYE